MKATLIMSFFRSLSLDHLERSLYSLSRQTVSVDEFLFFDNDSGFDEQQIRNVVAQHFSLRPIQFYFCKHGDRAKTLSWANNTAIRLCRTDAFILCRADYIYCYDFVAKMLAAYADNPMNYATAWMFGMNHGAKPVPDLEQFNWRENPKNLLQNSVGARPLQASHIDGPTFCTSKQAMELAGWYDETLVGWGFEQQSLQTEMVKHGVRMRVVPEFLYFHAEHDVDPGQRDTVRAMEVWKKSPRRIPEMKNPIVPTTPEGLLFKVLASGMLDLARATTLCHLLSQTRNVPGDVVEFGCHEGHTAKLMRSLMLPEKQLWLYDSFEGLPQPGEHDGNAPQYHKGAMAVSQDAVVDNFTRDGLTVPIIVPGWFAAISQEQLPLSISFAHLDGDLYESIRASLALVWPRMSQGAICVIDDWGNPELPGVSKAVKEFTDPAWFGCNPSAHQAWLAKL